MTDPTLVPKSPPLSHELMQPNPLRAPPTLAAFGLAIPSARAPLQIQLHLDGGCVLDVPLTQEAIDNLATVLDRYRSKP
jgi:hypothetical protein